MSAKFPCCMGMAARDNCTCTSAGPLIGRQEAVRRMVEAEAARDAAQAEAANVAQDYDRRGERLWRLAALAGHEPHEADNDATAEMVVRDALVERDALRATVAAVAGDR